MDYLLSQYKIRLRNELTEYGFRLYQKTFFRVINDIVQMLVLNKNGHGCIIEYGIMPLCYPCDEPACLHGGRYTIGRRSNNMAPWWVFFENTPTQIDPLVDRMIDLLREDTVPFFDRAVDSCSAYAEIIKLEKEIYPQVILNDYVKVCLCIKNSDFENAKTHMAAIVSQNESAISANIANLERRGDLRELAEYKSKFLPMLEQNKAKLDRISLPDIDYCRKLIEDNEERSREFLKKLGSKTRKS
jgi:hypothetical protein